MSDFCPIICGVPQGSILTLSSSDPVDLQSKLNHDLAQIQTWLQANKLSLNVKKKKIIFYYW